MKSLPIIILNLLFQVAIAQQPELVIPTGHSEEVIGITYSPNGKYLLSKSKNEIILWDATLARQVRKYNTTENNVHNLQFHPNSDKFITIEKIDNFKVVVWDLKNCDPVRSFDIKTDKPENIIFTSDGKHVIIQTLFNVLIYNFDNAELEKKISFLDYKSTITTTTCTNDGKRLLVGLNNNRIIIWDIANDKVSSFFEGHNIKANVNQGIASILNLPDNNHIFSISRPGIDEIFYIKWDINTGKVLYQSQVKNISRLFFSKDRSITILRKTDFKALLLNTRTGIVFDSISGYTDYTIHPNNQYFATSDYRDIKIIDFNTKKSIATLNGFSVSLANIWLTGEKVFRATSIFNALAYKSDNISKLPLQRRYYSGKYFPTQNNNILVAQKVVKDDDMNDLLNAFELYDQFQDKNIAEFKTKFNPSIELRDIATISGVVKYILLYDFKKSTQNSKEFYQLYNLEKDQVEKEYSYIKRNSHDPSPIFKFTPDGQNIISANYDFSGQIHLWKTSSFKPVKPINELYQKFGKIIYLDISADGKYLISATEDKHLTVFSLQKGQIELVKDLTEFEEPVYLTKFSENSKYLMVTSGNNVFVYDFPSLKLATQLKGHKASIADIKFIDAFNLFLSTATDNTSKFWDLNGKKVASIVYLDLSKEDNSRDFVVVTPDGYFDGTNDAIKKLHFVDGTSVYPLDALFEKYYTPGLTDLILNHQPVTNSNKNLSNTSDSKDISIKSLLPPPIVEIITPQNNTKSQTPSIELKVKISDAGGGVDEVRLYQNEKLIEGSERGIKKVEVKSMEIYKTYMINLVNGQNVLKVTAFNNQRTESNPTEVIITYEADKPKVNLYLLAIGVNQYKNATYNLNYAGADATSFVDIIKQKSSSIFSTTQVEYINDDRATRENILKGLDKIKQLATANDVFIFYYAGHGVMSEEENPQFFIIPTDVTKLYGDVEMLINRGISAKELQQVSKEIKAQKQLFILDACQSGGVIEMLSQRGAAEEKAIAQLARSTGTYWVAASGSNQFATEFKELGHGLFTHSILEGLNNKADGGDKDGKITVKELCAYIEDIIPQLTLKYKGQSQYPRVYGFGQDFPIVIVK